MCTPATTITFTGDDLTALKDLQAGATLTADEKKAVAAKVVEIFNTRAAAYGGVAELDANGTKVHFKDMNEGADGALAATITATGGPSAGAAGAAFDVGLTGTSFNEKFGMGTAGAGKLKVSQEGTANAGKSFSVRLGDATKMTGTANLRADKTLEEMGMTDGQSIDIIVGDDIHTYTIGKEIDKTSTMQQFMDDIVYDIGRTKIKAEIVDGTLSISTLDNSSLDIRSTNQVEVRDATKIAKSEFGVADRTLTNVVVTHRW